MRRIGSMTLFMSKEFVLGDGIGERFAAAKEEMVSNYIQRTVDRPVTHSTNY